MGHYVPMTPVLDITLAQIAAPQHVAAMIRAQSCPLSAYPNVLVNINHVAYCECCEGALCSTFSAG